MRKTKITEEQLKTALEAACGNVTQAAALVDPPISRPTVMRLTDRYGLKDFARDLRFAIGRAATGRPAKTL